MGKLDGIDKPMKRSFKGRLQEDGETSGQKVACSQRLFLPWPTPSREGGCHVFGATAVEMFGSGHLKSMASIPHGIDLRCF